MYYASESTDLASKSERIADFCEKFNLIAVCEFCYVTDSGLCLSRSSDIASKINFEFCIVNGPCQSVNIFSTILKLSKRGLQIQFLSVVQKQC